MAAIDREIMKARKTWNRAAYSSRAMTSAGAAEHLYNAALAIAELLRPFATIEDLLGDDDASEAGFGDSDEDLSGF